MTPTPEAQTKIQDRVEAASGYDWTMGDEALALGAGLLSSAVDLMPDQSDDGG
mgnify:CR=1 FL=1